MEFLRASWRYLVASVVLFGLGISLTIFGQRYFTGNWVNILSLIIIMIALIVVLIGGAITTIRKFPQFKATTVERYTYRIIGVMIMPLGYFCGELFNGPIVYEKELAQGFLTASSVLMALSGVLLTIARFPKTKPGPQDIMSGLFKVTLIFSLLAGFVTIFLVFFWYAKATSSFLEWAGFSFFVQLGYVLLFLFFPKYYLR
jgi:glucose uptake protein GlcU